VCYITVTAERVGALGYEDLNDHDTLRADPLLAVLAGRARSTLMATLRSCLTSCTRYTVAIPLGRLRDRGGNGQQGRPPSESSP
jgi:hypothetical protein